MINKNFSEYIIGELTKRKAEAVKRLDMIEERRAALRKRLGEYGSLFNETQSLVTSLDVCIHTFQDEAAAGEPEDGGICPRRS